MQCRCTTSRCVRCPVPAPAHALPNPAGLPAAHRTSPGPGSRPLGQVIYGVGNGGEGDGRDEGAVTGRVAGTYLHGPVLARNPALADLLPEWATGLQPPLAEFPEITRLRRQPIPAGGQAPPAAAAARA